MESDRRSSRLCGFCSPGEVRTNELQILKLHRLLLDCVLHCSEGPYKSYCSPLQIRLHRLIRSTCVNTSVCQRSFWNKVCVLLLVCSLTQRRLSISRVYLRYHYLSHNAHSLQTFFPRCLLHLGLLRKY